MIIAEVTVAQSEFLFTTKSLILDLLLLVPLNCFVLVSKFNLFHSLLWHLNDQALKLKKQGSFCHSVW